MYALSESVKLGVVLTHLLRFWLPSTRKTQSSTFLLTGAFAVSLCLSLTHTPRVFAASQSHIHTLMPQPLSPYTLTLLSSSDWSFTITWNKWSRWAVAIHFCFQLNCWTITMQRLAENKNIFNKTTTHPCPPQTHSISHSHFSYFWFGSTGKKLNWKTQKKKKRKEKR